MSERKKKSSRGRQVWKAMLILPLIDIQGNLTGNEPDPYLDKVRQQKNKRRIEKQKASRLQNLLQKLKRLRKSR